MMTFSDQLKRAVVDRLNHLPGGNFQKKQAFKKEVGCDENQFWRFEGFAFGGLNISLTEAESLMAGLGWRWKPRKANALKTAILNDGRSQSAIAREAGINRSLLCEFIKNDRGLKVYTADKIIPVVGLTWDAGKSATVKAVQEANQ